MNGYIELIYEKTELKNYIVEILQAEEAAFFLPVSFIEKENKTECVHKTEGFYPLRLMKEISIGDALEFVILFAAGIRDGERHYIFPEDYEINSNLIYTDEFLEKIKICFVPVNEGTGAKGKILEFLYFLENRVNEDYTGYIFQLEKYMGQGSCEYMTIESFVSSLKREIAEKNHR